MTGEPKGHFGNERGHRPIVLHGGTFCSRASSKSGLERHWCASFRCGSLNTCVPLSRGTAEERQRRSRGITRSQRNPLKALQLLEKAGGGFALSPWLEDSPVPLERGTFLLPDPAHFRRAAKGISLPVLRGRWAEERGPEGALRPSIYRQAFAYPLILNVPRSAVYGEA